jgi:hypothetical protein
LNTVSRSDQNKALDYPNGHFPEQLNPTAEQVKPAAEQVPLFSGSLLRYTTQTSNYDESTT